MDGFSTTPADERAERQMAYLAWLRQARPFALWGLVGLCVGVWIVMELSGGSTSGAVLLRFGAHYRPLIERGEWWRLLSSGFLHVGPVHLLLNMWCVVALGPYLERYYGPWKLTALFAFSVLGGSLGALVAYRESIAAGASGGISGWFGAVGVHYLSYRTRLTPGWGRRLGAWLLQVLIANVLIAVVVPNVGHAAHLGGLVFGAMFAAAVPSRPGFLDRPRPWAFPWAMPLLATVPALAMAGANAWKMRTDPWAYPMVHYEDPRFDLRYPDIFVPVADPVNVVLQGAGIRLDIGVLGPGDDELIARELSEVGREGDWTHHTGKIGPLRTDLFVHTSRWHIQCTGLPDDVQSFQPTLRRIVGSFRLR